MLVDESWESAESEAGRRGTGRRAWQQRVKYVLDWLVQINKAT